jgi:hypothetical protein
MAHNANVPFTFACVQNMYLASPNCAVPPRSIQELSHGQQKLCIEPIDTHWASNSYPFLPYAPVTPDFSGPLLGRLAYQRKSLPIEQKETGWCLSLELQGKWTRLENGLRSAALSLLTYRHTIRTEFSTYPFPREFGYTRAHNTKSQARSSAMRARDAFIPLMALCSFAISLHLDQSDVCNLFNPNAPTPQWARYLIDAFSVNPTWVENLRRSFVGDFTKQRIGAIINPYTWKHHEIIYPMILCNVPVWIYWSPSDLAAGPFQEYQPTLEQLKNAVQCSKCPRCSCLHTLGECDSSRPRPCCPTSLLPRGLHTIPPTSLPEQGSRQLQGESWHQFLERMEAHKHHRIEREKSVDKQRRLQREHVAASHQVPGHRGPRVFHWEEDIQHPGFRVRKPVPRDSVEGMWHGYGPKQRIYNGFLDEWDICTEFDIHEHPDDMSDSDSDEPQAMDVFIPSSTIGACLSQTIPPVDYSLDLAETYKPEIVEEPNLEWDPIEEFLYGHYGLIESRDAHPLEVDSEDVKKACKIFGVDEVRKILPRSWLLPMWTLFQHLIDLDHGPQPACDLDKNLLIRKTLEDSSISVERVENPNTKDVSYLLRGNKDDKDSRKWVVMVHSAASALHCIRKAPGPQSSHIVAFFLDYGVPFNTLAPLPQNPMPYKPHEIQLGWRNTNYEPDQNEYAAYEATRDTFLKSPRGRAALLTGGIVWRLSIATLHEDDILAGPSSYAAAYGVQHYSHQGWSCDDKLTSDELDLICGVYRVFTQPSGDQVSDKSWWPKHSAWMKSGLNWGIWTAKDENWFMRRLKLIREGKATVLSSTKWNSGVIKFEKHTSKCVATNESKAAEALKNICNIYQ